MSAATTTVAASGEDSARWLRENLTRLRRRAPGAARAVEEATRAGGPGGAGAEVELVACRRGGGCTISDRGTLLASRYDPEAEARTLAAAMSEEPVDLLVAVGMGLGLHLEAFQERHGCKLVVYEPSPQRLRAALAARPHLALLESEDVRVTTCLDELRDWIHAHYVPGLRMRVHPHPAVLRLDQSAVAEAVDVVGRAKDVADLRGRTQHTMAWYWAGLVARNALPILETPSLSPLAGCLAGRPAVVCAAGPSLDKQLPLLRAHRDRIFVVAIGQTLSALRKAGIEPDLVHVVEAQDVRVQLERAGDLSDVTLVLPPQANPALFELPVGRRLLSWQASNAFGSWMARSLGEKHLLLSGGTVAQSAVYLAAFLGASPILLIGQDLAFTGGRIYAKGSCYGDVSFEIAESGRYQLGNMKSKWGEQYPTDQWTGRLVWVEGWDGERVPSDDSYASFRESYRWISQNLAQAGQELWNCTEGGARIPPLPHLSFAEALERVATEPLDRGPFAEAPDHDPERARQALASALREVRRVTGRIQDVARRGIETCQAAEDEIGRTRDPARIRDALRRIGKCQHRARKLLRAGPLLEAFIQPELLALGADVMRAAKREPTPLDVAQESRALFQATAEAVERAARLFDQLDERLATEPE